MACMPRPFELRDGYSSSIVSLGGPLHIAGLAYGQTQRECAKSMFEGKHAAILAFTRTLDL